MRTYTKLFQKSVKLKPILLISTDKLNVQTETTKQDQISNSYRQYSITSTDFYELAHQS